MPCAANAQLHASVINRITLSSGAKPRQSRHRTGVTAHDRGSQVHQAVPMLFDQSDVDIGLAHRRDFGWHLGAAWHEQVALFQFLRPWAKIKAQQPGQCHRKIGVAVGVHRQLAGFKAFLTYDAFNGHASLALIEHEGLCVKDAPAVPYSRQLPVARRLPNDARKSRRNSCPRVGQPLSPRSSR